MSAETRTVHVNVLVTKSLPVDEPLWCAGHSDDRASFKNDIAHYGPEQLLSFRDETLWTIQLAQSPFASDEDARSIGVYVEQSGYAGTLHPCGLEQLADALIEHAAELRALALHLASLRGGGR